jgi:hypothetical protein
MQRASIHHDMIVRRNEGNPVEKSMSRMKFVRNVQYFVFVVMEVKCMVQVGGEERACDKFMC